MALVLETASDYRSSSNRAFAWNTKGFRRTLILVVGCGVMALSGGGLAGYLDLSQATAATPAPAADAAPLG